MKKEIYFIAIITLLILSCNDTKKNNNNITDSIEAKKVNAKDKQASPNVDLSSYKGSWFWKSEDSSASFKLVLSLKYDTVYGKYCAAYDFGNRLDCDFDTTSFNLAGTARDDSIVLRFNSFYGAEDGIALVKRSADSLLWKIVKYPHGGDCFAPKFAVMHMKLESW